MPRKSGRLTPQELTFARTYAATSDVAYASERAGYSRPDKGYDAISRPAVRAAVVSRQEALLTGELLPIANDLLRKAMLDPTVPIQHAIRAAAIVHQQVAELRREGQTGDKQPHEMAPDELAQAIASLQARLATTTGEITDVEPGGDDVFG